MKVLEELGAIELIETRPVRGALEHVYRATARPWFDDSHWAKLPVSVRRQFQDTALQGIWDHIVEAASNGGLDRLDTHISWTNLDLDEKGHEQMAELLTATLERALEIHAEAAGRRAELDEPEQEMERTELVLLHYQRPRANGDKPGR